MALLTGGSGPRGAGRWMAPGPLLLLSGDFPPAQGSLRCQFSAPSGLPSEGYGPFCTPLTFRSVWRSAAYFSAKGVHSPENGFHRVCLTRVSV